MGDRPAILLVTDAHRALLLGEFQRYARDYVLVPATSGADAEAVVASLLRKGHQLAMVAVEHHLPAVPFARLPEFDHPPGRRVSAVRLSAFGG